MRKLGWITALAALVLAGCGGGGDGSSFGSSSSGSSSSGGTTITVASVLLVSSTSSILSDGTTSATLTAYVRDTANQFVSDVPVQFTSDSGGLQVTQAVTDTNGVATATLTSAGDPANRTITVTATAETTSATATVAVTGTTLSVQGASSLTVGQTATYTVALIDAGANGISGRSITITPPSYLTVNPTSVTTDAQGHATFQATANAGGSSTISVEGLGITATQAVSVNSDSIVFNAPAANAEVDIKSATDPDRVVTVTVTQNGANVPDGTSIDFAITRGTFISTGTSTASVTTTGGQATVQVASSSAGGAVVSANLSGGATAQVSVEFVATSVASVDVQPSVFTVAPNGQSTITAIVRDADNNLVKNKTVVFSLTDDTTGGMLTIPSAVTDSQGRAQTVYTAGTTTSANNGVTITATVQGTIPPVTDSASLTVAGLQVFVSIGTGNEIFEPNTAQYRKEYIVQVTDSTGAGVENVPLSLKVLSKLYYKGGRIQGGTSWSTCYTKDQGGSCVAYSAALNLGCLDEDANQNGILDPGEDNNSSLQLEAGNIVTVSPNNATTDSSGFVLINIYYPQEYAYYLQVSLQAIASVQGTETTRTTTFMLEGLATDFSNINTAPPGPVSPFGEGTSCSDTL